MTASASALVAGAALAGACLLAAPRSPVLLTGAARGRGRRGRLPGLLAGGALVAVVAGAVGAPLTAGAGEVPGAVLAAALVLAAAAAGGARVLRAGRGRVRAAATSGRVLVACELLAAELQAGVPPSTALHRAAADWPVLEPVAGAAVMGADVPDALRAAAAVPGAGDLRRVAAAWDVSQRTGQGLATALARTAAGLRTTAATRRTVAAELASARATARLLAALPVVALLMGSGAGAAPWRFLLATPPGVVCLGLGLACGLVGLAWIERLAGAVEAGAA